MKETKCEPKGKFKELYAGLYIVTKLDLPKREGKRERDALAHVGVKEMLFHNTCVQYDGVCTQE